LTSEAWGVYPTDKSRPGHECANDAQETTRRLDVQSGDWINPYRPSMRDP
jgi:hypothetical protein